MEEQVDLSEYGLESTVHLKKKKIQPLFTQLHGNGMLKKSLLD